jgi:hypothetical protein
MTYELQVRAVPQPLAGACGGTVVELRELTYGQMRAAMRHGGEQELASEALLGAALHVDGEPLGLEGLLNLPGRFAGDVAKVMRQCHVMHGLMPEEPAPEGDETPKD